MGETKTGSQSFKVPPQPHWTPLVPQGEGCTPLLSSQAYSLHKDNQIPRGMRVTPFQAALLGTWSRSPSPPQLRAALLGTWSISPSPPQVQHGAISPGGTLPQGDRDAALLGTIHRRPSWAPGAAPQQILETKKSPLPLRREEPVASSRPLATRRTYNFCVDNSSS